jgi:hypothetical protein
MQPTLNIWILKAATYWSSVTANRLPDTSVGYSQESSRFHQPAIIQIVIKLDCVFRKESRLSPHVLIRAARRKGAVSYLHERGELGKREFISM